MLFNNIQLYRITRSIDISEEILASALESHLFTPCGNLDMCKFGWISPYGKNSEALLMANNGQIMLTARKEEKMIPASVIKDELESKIEELEVKFDRQLKKKEKDALKEEVLHTLLPRAFPRSNDTALWINPKERLIVVNAATSKKADDVLSLLRKCLGSLPVIPIALQNPPEITMTEWLNKANAPTGFAFGARAELSSALEKGGVVNCKDQDLASDEVKAHILAEKLVTALELKWDDTLTFTVSSDFAIKRIKYSEEFIEQNEDAGAEGYAARMDADFTLMTGALNDFIPQLINAFGGERVDQQ